MKKRSSIAFGFLALIVIGAILLAAPYAQRSGAWGEFLPSLFTACSAVCVTGLSVVDISSQFSPAGLATLFVLVEVGCMGLMTFGTFLMIAIGRRLSLSREFSLMNAYGVAEIQGLRSLICWVIGLMVTLQGVGALALLPDLGDWWQAVFYSAMSFCNAGFSILPGSAAAFADVPRVVVIMATETILGGIGFLVIYNLCTFKFLRRISGGRGRISLHSSVVLRFTAWLIVIALAVFLLLEWNGALAGFSPLKKLYVGFFQAVTPRTCGFSIVPTESLRPVTRLFYEALMFIGGAPGSAAAGIKVTTLAVLIYTLRAMCRGENETVISRRVIAYDTVRESLVIFMALISLVVIVVGALMITDGDNAGMNTNALVFEAVSAITTTGLTCGDTTASLSTAGKVVIMLAMFMGRLGALSVVMMIGDRETTRNVRYPHEELVVG